MITNKTFGWFIEYKVYSVEMLEFSISGVVTVLIQSADRF